MKKQKGFSVIELMVAVAIIGIIATIVAQVVSGKGSDVSFGINGVSETRCIGGYKFIIGQGGQARQILNEQGGGIHCEQ